jgi:hypothetical protein
MEGAARLGHAWPGPGCVVAHQPAGRGREAWHTTDGKLAATSGSSTSPDKPCWLWLPVPTLSCTTGRPQDDSRERAVTAGRHYRGPTGHRTAVDPHPR